MNKLLTRIQADLEHDLKLIPILDGKDISEIERAVERLHGALLRVSAQ